MSDKATIPKPRSTATLSEALEDADFKKRKKEEIKKLLLEKWVQGEAHEQESFAEGLAIQLWTTELRKAFKSAIHAKQFWLHLNSQETL